MTLGYVRDTARNLLHQHPHLHAFYKQNKYRMITSYLRKLPDFVIIGAQKSGTTSLYDFVVRHPEIASATIKELRYFSHLHKFGELWYRSNFPINLSRYNYFFQTSKRFTGEASPHYLFWQIVPNRMKEILPDVKLIVILRNPVDRAYSHYHMALRIYNESLSFEKAIELEEERCARIKQLLSNDPYIIPKYYFTHTYLANGVYVDQLENWFRYYDRERFLILTTEDFRENPQQTLDQIFNFLGVHQFQIKYLRNLNIGNYKEMSKNTRKFLIEYFRPHNQRLSKLLRRNFNWDK